MLIDLHKTKNYRNIIFLSFFLLTSCNSIINLISKDPDTEGKSDIKSKYNADNTIFTIDKLYTYEVTQKFNDQDIKFNLTCQVIPGKYNGGTKIKYKYYYPQDIMSSVKPVNDTLKEYLWEITSVDESSSEITIHPPRSYTLKSLELAAFPSKTCPVLMENRGKLIYG